MFNIKSDILSQITRVLTTEYGKIDGKFINITNSTDKYGTYSIKSFVGLLKQLTTTNATEIYNIIIKNTNLSDNFDTTLNPKSIDFKLKANTIISLFKATIKNILIDKIEIKQNPLNILVDFSSPNIAKDMHVGHLRSTIIGDSICRLYESQHHNVSRINHIGDFGLQFGMIIQHLLETHPDYTNHEFTISDLQNFYAQSKKRFDTCEIFKTNSYNNVVLLQAGQSDIVNAWNYVKKISKKSYDECYDRLGIVINDVGESFYQKYIPETIEELKAFGLVTIDEGRHVVNLPNFVLPLTLIKSDGGYTYDTTDLAAIRYRTKILNMDKIIYVVDNGQSLHFKLIFEVARLMSWIREGQIVEHVGFGLVLDHKGKKFKSRDGDTVKLRELLDESVTKAAQVVKENQDHVIQNIAYGSIKYADLSTVRTNDYKFSFEKMISFKGNTCTYQLYEYARICAIIRKSGLSENDILKHFEDFNITDSNEEYLCKIILAYPEIIERINNNLMFHVLCSYLYDLSIAFSVFHKKCKCAEYSNSVVININYNRLLICLMTKYILSKCFDILGINSVDQM